MSFEINTVADEVEQAVRNVRRALSRQTLQEALLWALLATAALGGIILSVSYDRRNLAFVLVDHYTEVMAAFVILLFPIVFNLVFGTLPFAALRLRQEQRKVQNARRDAADKERSKIPAPDPSPPSIEALLEYGRIATGSYGPFDNEAAKTPLDNLRKHSLESRLIAGRLFSRAGIYLLIGVMIAATGLAFFYSQGALATPPKDLTSAAVLLAPRFGILFFIEFLAFFFLRQYRAAMDEFRYYEGVARTREEMVVVFLLLENNDESHIVEAIRAGAFSSKTVALAAGQSTEILEAKKLEGSDLAGLAKILEGLAAFKK